MNAEIDTLDFALVLEQAFDLCAVDAQQRQALAACSPVPWATSNDAEL
jgi:hypothetical protein